MPTDQEPDGHDEPLSFEHRPSAPGAGGKLRENLLLFSGLGLVLLAAGMVLSNILA
ncbi:hypothetical protein [Roseibium denhamense]|uniref:hypothetical protein n=1 Tax=Roseibium denhamense TaxID=76305 RepID=UPI0031CE3152